MKGTIGIYEYQEREIDLDEYPGLQPKRLTAFKATENGVLAYEDDRSPEVRVEATYPTVGIVLEFWEEGGHDDIAMLQHPNGLDQGVTLDEWDRPLLHDMTIQQWVNAAGRFVIDSFGGVYGSEDDYQDEND